MAGIWDQYRLSDIDALSKYILIGVETNFEGYTLVREYHVINPCECHRGGRFVGKEPGRSTILESSMHDAVYSS